MAILPTKTGYYLRQQLQDIEISEKIIARIDECTIIEDHESDGTGSYQ